MGKRTFIVSIETFQEIPEDSFSSYELEKLVEKELRFERGYEIYQINALEI